MGRSAFLDEASNMFGPLKDEYRARIMAHLTAPTAETWDGCHGVVICSTGRLGGTTVWQAVCKIAPEFTRIGRPYGIDKEPTASERWIRWPDAVTTARAIRDALAAEKAKRSAGAK